MKSDPQSQTKREELTTYKRLGLGRALKSRAQRARMERTGIYTVLGGDSDRPYLQVTKLRYRAVRLEVIKEYLLQLKASRISVSPDQFLQQFQSRIEGTIYDRLRDEQEKAVGLEGASLRHYGRGLTKEEKISFAESSACESATKEVSSLRHSRALIDGILQKIENRQTHNPTRYQTAWAEAVGIEAAQQSYLEKIDPAGAIVYFRCCNSVLSYQIQRQAGLPKKLSQLLKVPVRQLRVFH